MIDLTPLLQAVISLLAAIITVYFIPWLKAQTTARQREMISAAVHTAVYGAEKLYGAGNGAEKLVYAREWLRSQGFEIDPERLTMEIDAAIREMEQADGDFFIEEVVENEEGVNENG